jgi:membrane-bound metal-dependent hydrolase YbcI (DUF457 family)
MLGAGHLALGYIAGTLTAKVTRSSINLPLLLFIAVIPDIDYLFPDIGRRTITHSLLVQLVIASPFLIKYRQHAIPYLGALISHDVIDLFNVAGVQLLWPISTYNHPIIPYRIISQVAPYMEVVELGIALFVFIVMIVTGVVQQMGTSHGQILLLLGSLGSLAASIIAVRVFMLPLFLSLAQLSFIVLLSWPILRYIAQIFS